MPNCAQDTGPVTPRTTALHSPPSRGQGDGERIKIRVMGKIKQQWRERRGAAVGAGRQTESPLGISAQGWEGLDS